MPKCTRVPLVCVKEIDALLPQTQCGECGYQGCLPYAEALAQGTAQINQCPPGGVRTIKALGALLNRDPTPYLDDARAKTRAPSVAVIHESECIGCTKCIKACPVDAIIGSSQFMHAVIAHACTGCGLCVTPCPVDCIEMVTQTDAEYDRDLARKRFNDKKTRLLREQHEQQQTYREKRQFAVKSVHQTQDIQDIQHYIQHALKRVKEKKSHE